MFEFQLVDCSDFADKAVYETKFSCICEERQNRISRLKNEKARYESLGASVALEELIGACELNGPLNFEYGKTGKPHLKNTFLDGRKVYISLTHKYPMAAAVISDKPVGIDIEKIGPYKERIAERFFSEKDRQFIADATSDEDRQLRFYKVWTFKEAYCKCMDISLADNLEKLDYDEMLCRHFVESGFLVTISLADI